MNLVTGSTGILGMRIMYDLLKQGSVVNAMKRKNSDLDVVKKVFDFYNGADSTQLFDKINWIDGDVRDLHSLAVAMEGCEYIYHCAAIVSFHPRDREEMYNVNQRGTENLVNIALEKGIKKLCHISSIAAIGRSKIGQLITEENDWIPSKYNAYYAVTKYGAEREVWRGTQEGLPAVIVNPGIIIGAGTSGKSSASIFSTVQNGLTFYTQGSGSVVDVRDVARIAIQATESTVVNERFILVSENLPFRSLFDKIADSLNKPRSKFLAKKWLLSIAWIVFKIKDGIFRTKSQMTRESARAANSEFLYSSEKAKRTFNLEFRSCQEAVDYFSSYYL